MFLYNRLATSSPRCLTRATRKDKPWYRWRGVLSGLSSMCCSVSALAGVCARPAKSQAMLLRTTTRKGH